MMQATLCRDGNAIEGGHELLDAWRTDDKAWLWIDLHDEPRETEKALLINELNFDELAVTEAQRPRHPPGFEAYDDYLYLLLKPLTAESETLDFDTLQLALFASPRLLVTRHSKPSRYLDRLHSKLRKEGCGQTSPMALMAAIARRVTNRYGKILLGLEQRLDAIEDDLFETRTDRLMQELVGYNTALRKMRRILTYHTDAFLALRDHLDDEESEDWHSEFDDIHALMERFHSLSDLYQSVISDLIEAYISLNGHRLNQIMKVLTIVTVIFVPLTLLVGIYGMNFENIPELKSRYGYFVLLGTMAAIAVALLAWFRKVRWL